MKTNRYILSFHKWILILGTGILIFGCELKEEPIQNIYKAKPLHKAPEVEPKENKVDKTTAPSDSLKPADPLTPVDSTSKSIQDTTETLHRIEKKPSKPYRKLYLYNIHKKPLIS